MVDVREVVRAHTQTHTRTVKGAACVPVSLRYFGDLGFLISISNSQRLTVFFFYDVIIIKSCALSVFMGGNKEGLSFFLFFFPLYLVQDAEVDSERSIQMSLLRRLCLPMMTFLLLTVLQRTERHQESLRLADIIASDQHRLYEVRLSYTHTHYLCIKKYYLIVCVCVCV